MFSIRYITLILLCYSTLAVGQNFNNNWIFGYHAGIDFNTVPPTTSYINPINAEEATSSISDFNGNLLFYTNGIKVWNKNHSQMPNGSGLSGGTSSTQVLIVAKPGSCDSFYIFHVGDHMTPNTNLRYTVIDLSLNGGTGDVPAGGKNILLNSSSSEKITAVKHQNGVDTWVVTHDLGSNAFRTFLVTSNGISSSSVISNIGFIHPYNGMIGYLKPSHKGDKLVSLVSFLNSAEMYDFDNSTGVVSNMEDLVLKYNLTTGLYGVEFSPNDSLIYITDFYGGSSLFQLERYSNTKVQLSQLSGDYLFGALQLGPDGKIYMAKDGSTSLGVINDPDVPGIGCNFNLNGFQLAPNSVSQLGLPNFVQSYFLDSTQILSDFIYSDTTCSDSTYFSVNINTPYDSVRWNFGDTLSQKNFSLDTIVWHSFTESGFYNVKLTVYSSCITKVITKTIKIEILNDVLGKDISICQGDSILIDPGLNIVGNYNWSNNSVDTAIWINSAGTYWLDYNYGSCNVVDTIQLSYKQFITEASQDTMVCINDTVNLIASGGIGYQWFNSSQLISNDSMILVKSDSNEVYKVVIQKGSCGSDTIEVNVDVFARTFLTISNDTTICKGDTAYLAVNGGSNYLWRPSTYFTNPGDTQQIISPLFPQKVFVDAIDSNGCKVIDSVFININEINLTISPDTLICIGDSANLVSTAGYSYSWFPGNGLSDTSVSNPVANPVSSTLYYLTVFDSLGCSAEDSVFVDVLTPLKFIMADTMICLGDSIQLFALGEPNSIYNWHPTNTLSNSQIKDPIALPLQNTTYSVVIKSPTCKADTLNINLIVNPKPVINTNNDTTICEGEKVQLFASGGAFYQWSPSTFLSDSVSADPISSPDTNIIYLLTVIDTLGCSSFDSVAINIFKYNSSISSDSAICFGESIQLFSLVDSLSTFSWSPISALDNPSSSSPTASPDSTTIYSLIIDHSICGFDTLDVLVTVHPPVFANAFNDTSIKQGQMAELTAITNGNSFIWWPSSGLDCPTCLSTLASPNSTTTYYFQAQDSYGCTKMDSVNIIILQLDCTKIAVPNAFSPNNDGINDTYRLIVVDDPPVLRELLIFNRWGELVFETNDINAGWNGQYKGKNADIGVYAYLIRVDCNGEEKLLKGNITLIR